MLLIDGLGLFEIAILATMLAPTDAALGKAVVSNESVPANIREGLNVESGLNDGICVPILFVFLALITWVVFGAAVVGQSIGHFTWSAVLYAVLSLTVIRMLPVWLSIGGMGLKSDAKLFLGWFGPRAALCPQFTLHLNFYPTDIPRVGFED